MPSGRSVTESDAHPRTAEGGDQARISAEDVTELAEVFRILDRWQSEDEGLVNAGDEADGPDSR